MDCRTARDRLLTADLDALDPRRRDPLADHLRACAACAAAAQRIVDASAALAAGLVPGEAPAPEIAGRRKPVRRLRAATIAALAAAALLLFILRGSDLAGPAAPPAAASAPVPVISVPEGRNAVVFRTADPTITVVWYY